MMKYKPATKLVTSPATETKYKRSPVRRRGKNGAADSPNTERKPFHRHGGGGE